METKDLILRDFKKEDLNDYFEYMSSEEVQKFILQHIHHLSEAEIDIKFAVDNRDLTAAILKQEHKLIGHLYHHQISQDEIELGFAFHPKYWSKGYAKQACLSLIKEGFKQKIKKYIAQCDKDNVRSIYLLGAIGFKKVKESVDPVSFNGQENHTRIVYLYELDAKDFYEKRANDSDESFTRIFSQIYPLDDDLIRYYDDDIKEMYDHNYFLLKNNMNDDVLNIIEAIKEARQEKHIKIISGHPVAYLNDKGFEMDEELTMMKLDYDSWNFTLNNHVVIKNLNKDDIFNDILAMELKYYGKLYGENFIISKLNRYQKENHLHHRLNFFAAYLHHEIVGYCYTYYDDFVVGLDDLLVAEEFRHQKIASTLLKYIADYYHCPIYLHADNFDTPKEMYQKYGFASIKKIYTYLKLDKKD